MTTKLTIFNHGPHEIKVSREAQEIHLPTSPLVIFIGRVAPGTSQDFYIWEQDLRIEEEKDV